MNYGNITFGFGVFLATLGAVVDGLRPNNCNIAVMIVGITLMVAVLSVSAHEYKERRKNNNTR